MALPRPLEAAVQDLERLARDVSVKIDEAAEAVAGAPADASIVRRAHELAQAVREVTRPRTDPPRPAAPPPPRGPRR